MFILAFIMAKIRKNIPIKIQGELLFKSDRECVVCSEPKRGDQIHHIDGNPSNNAIDNLVLLCFDCHHDASVTNGLRKGLIPSAIKLYRDHKYEVVAVKRANALKAFNSPIGELNTEEMLTVTKNALIMIELEKIKAEFKNMESDDYDLILEKISVFSEHTNFRLAVDVFNFIALIADYARIGLPADKAFAIYRLILSFFPYSSSEADSKKVIMLASQCIGIGFSLVYDSVVYTRDLKVSVHGLMILKYAYLRGKQERLDAIMEEVRRTYTEIEKAAQRDDAKGKQEAIQLIELFKQDLEDPTLAYPVFPKNLMQFLP